MALLTTEGEWLASIDPKAMLKVLSGDVRSASYGGQPNVVRVGLRKHRLLAAGFLRTVWSQLDAISREAVECAEGLADGTVGESERGRFHDTDRQEVYPARAACFADPVVAAHEVLFRLMRNHRGPIFSDHGLIYSAESLADVVRGIVGNPFRPLTFSAEFRESSLVMNLAEAAYQERDGNGLLDPDRLVILADALEDAGFPTHEQCRPCKGTGSHAIIMTIDQRAWIMGEPESVWHKGSRPAPCEGCKGTGKVLQLLLARLRDRSKPHYRGDWALDLVRGAVTY